MTLQGTFTLTIDPLNPHATTLTLDCPNRSPESDKWFDFLYCNDLLWRAHAASWEPSRVVMYMALIKPELYQKFLTQNGPNHFLIGD